MISLEARYLLKALALPPGGFVVIGLAGLLALRRLPRVGRLLLSVSLLGIWALSTPIVSDSLAHAMERYPAFDPLHLTTAEQAAQAIVILGGGIRDQAPEYGGDAPAPATLERLIEGAKVARATRLPILVSGSPREAVAMRRFLVEDLQTPVKWMEAASGDTRENAVFSARILHPAGVERVLLVTSSLHLPRSVGEFRAAGFEVAPVPAEMITREGVGFREFVPNADAFHQSHVAFYELGGQIIAALRHRGG